MEYLTVVNTGSVEEHYVLLATAIRPDGQSISDARDQALCNAREVMERDAPAADTQVLVGATATAMSVAETGSLTDGRLASTPDHPNVVQERVISAYTGALGICANKFNGKVVTDQWISDNGRWRSMTLTEYIVSCVRDALNIRALLMFGGFNDPNLRERTAGLHTQIWRGKEQLYELPRLTGAMSGITHSLYAGQGGYRPADVTPEQGLRLIEEVTLPALLLVAANQGIDLPNVRVQAA